MTNGRLRTYFFHSNDKIIAFVRKSDLLLFHRSLRKRSVAAFVALKKKKKLIIYTFYDNGIRFTMTLRIEKKNELNSSIIIIV